MRVAKLSNLASPSTILPYRLKDSLKDFIHSKVKATGCDAAASAKCINYLTQAAATPAPAAAPATPQAMHSLALPQPHCFAPHNTTHMLSALGRVAEWPM